MPWVRLLISSKILPYMPFLCCHWRWCSYIALIRNFAKHAIFVCCRYRCSYLAFFSLYVQKLGSPLELYLHIRQSSWRRWQATRSSEQGRTGYCCRVPWNWQSNETMPLRHNEICFRKYKIWQNVAQHQVCHTTEGRTRFDALEK
jgi:hypothetical protein